MSQFPMERRVPSGTAAIDALIDTSVIEPNTDTERGGWLSGQSRSGDTLDEYLIMKTTILAATAAALLMSLAVAPVVQAAPKGPQNFKNAKELPPTKHPKGPKDLKDAKDLPKSDHPKHADKHKHKHDKWKALAPAIIAGIAVQAMQSEQKDCGYYKYKYKKTGNGYWMDRYYACID